MKTTTKKLESEYPCSPSLVYFFISAVVKKKKKKFSSGSSTLSHWRSRAVFEQLQRFLPPSERKNYALSLCFGQEETTMRMTDAWGNFKMKAWDGGGGWVGESRYWTETSSGILNANISVHFLPVVLFSQRSRMFLFLIIARPDAKFSPATCWRSEKASSWFLLRWTPGE